MSRSAEHHPLCECSTYMDSSVREWWLRFRWTLLGVTLGVATVRLVAWVIT